MRVLTIYFLMILLGACSHKKNDPVLAEAANVHEEAMHIFHELEDLLKSLKQNDSIPLAKLESIKSALLEWEENLVEVPGYEHEHGHEDHGHHHHHEKKDTHLTSEEMLQLQTELRNNIMLLLEQAKALLNE